jgi:hypothetical protein
MEFHNSLTVIMKTMMKSHEELIRSVCDELGVDDKADELIAKLLDTSYKAVKPKKDPNRVKKPKSSYLFFCDDKRPQVQKDNPGKRMGDISKVLGDMWKKLSVEDRVEYQTQNEEDTARYENEK